MADWASLPHELLILIVELMKKFDDFAAFGTVCKSWHAAASKEDFKEIWLRQRTPYLMLTVKDGNKRDLYSLAEGEIVASVRVRNFSQRKCYESLGWFLAVEKDGSMCLLDPFSSIEIPLLHLNTLLKFERYHPFQIVKKMVLSARPCDPNDPSDFVVALIFRCIAGVAFWRPGDKCWSLRKSGGRTGMYKDITYHDGIFYTLDSTSEVNAFNISKGYPKNGKVITRLVTDDELADNMHIISNLLGGTNLYIVKMPDSLLVVRFTLETTKFQVYKFDISSNTWSEINDIGNMSLFLGSENATTAVNALRFPSFIKGNHIYFSRNPVGSDGRPSRVSALDMGIYNMENGMIDPVYHGEEFSSNVSHPTWILPFLWSLTADEMHAL